MLHMLVCRVPYLPLYVPCVGPLCSLSTAVCSMCSMSIAVCSKFWPVMFPIYRCMFHVFPVYRCVFHVLTHCVPCLLLYVPCVGRCVPCLPLYVPCVGPSSSLSITVCSLCLPYHVPYLLIYVPRVCPSCCLSTAVCSMCWPIVFPVNRCMFHVLAHRVPCLPLYVPCVCRINHQVLWFNDIMDMWYFLSSWCSWHLFVAVSVTEWVLFLLFPCLLPSQRTLHLVHGSRISVKIVDCDCFAGPL